MIYALDSNIISYFLKGDERIRHKFREVTINKDAIIIPPIVYYEIKRGFYLNPAPAKEKVFEQMCINYVVGSLNAQCLDYAARLYAALRAYNPEDADILIAAFCVVNAYTLVTANTRHFCRVENLRFINWAE